jgi:putative ATPase
MYQPLADALRPQELSDVCGQQHILGENGLLRRIIESGSVPNMIFYGPSGTGKTTVANLIAKKTQRKLCKLNATTASSADIKEIYAQLDTFLAPNGVLLYLDEIQYFNKKQQQTLLEYIENGKITLIASTTENPYFYVYNAILSRSTVFEFKPVEKDEAQRAVSRALNYLEARDSVTILPEPGVKEHIAQSCGGDIRKALNAVEFLYTATRPENGVVRLTMADAKQVSQRSAMRYDKSGDDHYDDLSALMKSIRGSDPDAAVHYLARFLEAGDLVTPCRICRPPAAASCALWRRISALPIRRPSPSSRPASTALCSWACRRRVCRWPTRFFSLPRPRSPIPAAWPSMRPSPM